MTPVLELRNIYQKYTDKEGKEFVLFDNFSLVIEDHANSGQFVALMGESGCGKSTILRYLTGLQTPDKGEILFYGNPITKKDTIPMVFQNPSSLEWYSVLDNVALPLILKGVEKKEAHAKAMEMIKIVDLEGHETKFAKYPLLSGGQLQRVAIARSLVANPKIIVMDEPFSALDIHNRRKMQTFLMNLFQNGEKIGIDPTIILVTHDEREAVYLANDIFVMGSKPGRIKSHLKTDFPKPENIRTQQNFLDAVNYLESELRK